jgi:hypothetical protein
MVVAGSIKFINRMEMFPEILTRSRSAVLTITKDVILIEREKKIKTEHLAELQVALPE